MVPIVRFLLSCCFSALLSIALAQKPNPEKVKPVPVQKFKPPKLTSFLGINSDSTAVYLEEALQLVQLPLKITDDKKTSYSISSYQVMYKRKAVTEDEATGKVTPVTSNVAALFRETPISGIWKKMLAEQLKQGEELYFFDIIVKDTQGRYMFAPDLKIKVK